MQSVTSTDVLVVGAGPAGCALAYLLRQAGRDVLLLEHRRIATKDKLCGGILTGDAQRHLAAIYGAGVLDGLDAARVDTMRVLYRERETSLPMDFRALPRARLDAFLLEQAVRAGARLAERTTLAAVDEAEHCATVRDLDTGEERQVAYGTLVAADGALSATRRLLTGRCPETLVSYEATTPPPPDGAPLVQRVYPAVAGGCWLIPQGSSAIVGCLFFPEASSEPVGDQRQRVRDFAAELGCPLGRLRGAPVPTGTDICLRSAGGTYFLGDAAGLIEPALGAGIHLALESAQALAEELAGGVAYAEALAPTAARLQKDAGSIAFAAIRLGYRVLTSA